MKTWQKWSLVVVLGALLAVWIALNFEWVEITVPGKQRGEARKDSHYAARLLVERLDRGGRTMTDPDQIVQVPEKHTMAALNLFPNVVARRLEPALVEWVKRGGHLVIVVPGMWQSEQFTEEFGLHRLGVHPAPRIEKSYRWDAVVETVQLEGRTLKTSIAGCDVFKVDHPLVWSATVRGYRPYSIKDRNEESGPGDAETKDKPKLVDEDALALARWQLGKGHVTAVCNDNFLNNHLIGKHDNAELAARVLLRDVPGEVIFISNADYPSLFEWLGDKAWPALISAGLLILLLIWHRMPRFSAVVPEPTATRPGLREHLLGMARFHLKRRHYQHLLQASREQVWRLAERHSGGRPMTTADIAALTGVTEHELRTALDFTPQHHKTYADIAAVLARTADALARLSLSTDSARKP